MIQRLDLDRINGTCAFPYFASRTITKLVAFCDTCDIRSTEDLCFNCGRPMRVPARLTFETIADETYV